jgi:hypothetical protein
MGTGGSFPGREADHSPPTSAEIKKIWIYTSTPHKPSWCSEGQLNVLPLTYKYLIHSPTHLSIYSFTSAYSSIYPLPQRRAFPEKLIVTQLFMKLSAFYGTGRSITEATKDSFHPCPQPFEFILIR